MINKNIKSVLVIPVLLTIMLALFSAPALGLTFRDPMECITMYASFAQNVAKNRDKNIPKQIIEKVIEDNAKKANISLTDDQVLVAKDVINYVYSNKNLSPEQIFQTKLYECLDKEGIIKPNKNA